MNQETTLWKGSPSQYINSGAYALCVLFCGLIIPAFIFLPKWMEMRWCILICLCWLTAPALLCLWKWINTRSRVYELTSQRLKTSTGVLTRRTDELELYRVKDITMIQPFWMRLLGLGRIVLTTHDDTSPEIMIEGIPDAETFREHLRTSVEACREQKRVRLTELE